MLSVPFYIALVAVALTIISSPATQAQEKEPQAKIGSDTFFSGNVVDVAADHVTVSRTVLGKAAEQRTFKITPATRVEGKMKQKSRVTVRYAASEDGEVVALAIIVRPDKAENKKK